MKLYISGRAPNPRRVTIFLAEKTITVPTEQVDLGSLAHRGPEFTAINPMQRVPALMLDDGTVITEAIAICRYFEAQHPEPPLFGRDPKSRAIIEMWERRVDSHFLAAVSNVFRHTHPAMKAMEGAQVAEWGEINRQRAMAFVEFLDKDLGDRPFIAGEEFSVADITAMLAVDFMKPAKIAVPEALENLRRWHAAVSSRPSASA